MVDQTLDAIRLVQESNKARLHEEQMKELLNDLLKKYDADDLIDYIMQQSEKY